MGCPDKSVFNRGGGAGLILQPKLAKEIILSVKRGCSKKKNRIPVSVKQGQDIRNMKPRNG